MCTESIDDGARSGQRWAAAGGPHLVAVAGRPGRGGRDLIDHPVDGDHDGIGCE
jgi:hypothetical protein